MKYLVKYLFIIILTLQATLCFSVTTEEQIQLEEVELNNTILAPFISNYNDDSSIIRLMSLEMIKQQKIVLKRPFATIQEAQDYYKQMLTKKPFNDPKRMLMTDEFRKCQEASDNENSADGFSEWLQMSWKSKVADCSEYAHLVMVIFEFNQMNHALLNKPSNFKQALYINTDKDGDHSLVIVIGRSGTVFAVDPWIWTVKKLNPDESGYIVLSEQITPLYKDIYYDMITVNYNTTWDTSSQEDKFVKKNVNTKGKSMESLYNLLKPKFPNWKSYNDLFPSSATTSKSEPGNEQDQFEHKHE